MSERGKEKYARWIELCRGDNWWANQQNLGINKFNRGLAWKLPISKSRKTRPY